MALERRSGAGLIYLQAKHYFLWRELKKEEKGCDVVEVTNPKTGQKLTKYGIGYHTVSGRVTKIAKYDTEKKYATRFFGFKLHFTDGVDSYVFDMPYNSQALRRFLAIAPNVNWDLPLSVTVFKGTKKENATGADPTVIWFRQKEETVKSFFTKDNPNGMPQATQDWHSKEWDFRTQRRWLVDYMIENIVPKIEMAAARVAPPVEPMPEHIAAGHDGDEPEPDFDPYGGQGITDDDLPF